MTDKKIKKVFASRLNNLIKKNGFIQQDIVDKFSDKGIKVSRGMVSNWCSGKFLPRYEYTYHLVEILGCEPKELLKIQ